MESTTLLPNQSSLRVGWRFWLQWVLANAFGFGIGFPLGIIPFLLLTEGHTDIPFRVLVGSLGWIVVGAFVGIMQWLALRPVLSDARWIVATITGWAAGVGISAVLPLAGMPAALPPLGMAGLALAYGAGAGVLQTLVLRCSAPRAVAWVLVSAAGWALGWAFLIPLEQGLWALGTVVSMSASGATVGTVSGALTGLALAWLLRPSEQAANGQPA